MPVFRHVFGPVPSRRFGRSLGVDLTPLKTCSFDCIFCQLGPTPHTTLERREYVPVPAVKEELLRWRNAGGHADYATLSGSGEPTLHSGFGEILRFMKTELPCPAVLLSNGSLFHLAEVRAAAAGADIVKLSLSAWDGDSFRRVNRPHPDLDFDRHLAGMSAFRKTYSGQIWLEVFLVPGLNSSPENVARIAARAEAIAPDKIHLNTAVRPPAQSTVQPLPAEGMESLVGLFQPRATVIAAYSSRLGGDIQATETQILDMLRRRPCTVRQIAEVFGLHPNEVAKYTGGLLKSRQVQTIRRGDGIFFAAK